MLRRTFRGSVKGHPIEVELHDRHFNVVVNGELAARHAYEDGRRPRVLISLPDGNGGRYCTEVRVEPLGPTAFVLSRFPSRWLCVCEYPDHGQWVRLPMA